MFELKECENLMINKELIEHKGKRRLCVAPMLDWTDRHYRYLARQITRNAWLYSEMVNMARLFTATKTVF